MQVPDVLAAGWLIVLAHGHAVAGVPTAHGDGYAARHSGDSARQVVGQRVDVLEVRQRDHERTARVVPVPVPADLHQHVLVAPGRELGLGASRDRV